MNLNVNRLMKYFLLFTSCFFLPYQMVLAATTDILKSDEFIFGTTVDINNVGIVRFDFVNKTGLTIKDLHLFFTDSNVSFTQELGGVEPFVLNNPFTSASLTSRTLNLWGGQGIAPDQISNFSIATTAKNANELFKYQATFNGTELITRVPEPPSYVLWASGLLVIGALKYVRRRGSRNEI